MSALSVVDLVLVGLVVAGAVGYMLWKIVLKPRFAPNPAVRLGPALSRSVRLTQERREKAKSRR